ncbi:MAG TPA: PQQ-binding-like beta-propeller repeat protein [Thermoanaerobaculia bacterium]|nr:PQQ-binding-like beta-propeller repeat protein [Thermoanaerobaculia bacterium]
MLRARTTSVARHPPLRRREAACCAVAGTTLALALLGVAAGHASADLEVSMIAAPGDPAESWPRWRGPSGQGLVTGSGYVDRWSTTENVLWKTAVPGRGNSSPIVWNDRVFLTTAYDGGARRSVLAFSRRDGRQLWETSAPADASPERAYPKNGHASSTPSTDGERLYAYFGNHGLLALDLEGKQVWHVPMGPFDAYHGTACSPLLYRDRVVVVQDQGSGSFIAAFDKDTGRELWRTPRPTKVGWSSPVAIRVGSDPQAHDEIVVNSQQHVFAYDPDSGKELWRAGGTTFEVIPTPVVSHGLLFSTSGRAGPTLAIRPGGSGDVTETHVVWSSPKGSPFVPAPIAIGDYLYMVNDMASVISVYRAATGEVLWQERLGQARRESFSAAPVAFDGKVFFTNDNGETFVVRQGPEFAVLHVNSLDEGVIASPALVGGVWYWRTAGHLYAIGSPE